MIRLRERKFWLKDKIFGGNVKTHYNEVGSNNDSSIKNKNIDNLLNCGTEKCKFYNFLKPNINLENFSIIIKI